MPVAPAQPVVTRVVLRRRCCAWHGWSHGCRVGVAEGTAGGESDVGEAGDEGATWGRAV
jgi:hypothetical protein